MDLNGHRKIRQALQEGGVANGTVLPVPAEGEHEEYVTVTAEDRTPEAVLNALGKAGLLAPRGSVEGEPVGHSGPLLAPLFGGDVSVTFVDTRYESQLQPGAHKLRDE